MFQINFNINNNIETNNNYDTYIMFPEDFIDFSKNKIKSYNDRSNEEFPKINISYTWYDYTWLVSFMALYNWWTRTWWMVKPNNPSYVFDGYWEEYSKAKKYWTFPMFIKILELELKK